MIKAYSWGEEMKPSHLVILLLMNFCWAAVYSAYKVVGEVLPTGAIVTLRFGIAGLMLLAVWPFMREPAPRGWALVKTCLLGLMLYVGGQRLQVYGNNLGSAANSSVLMSMEPLMTSVAAALLLREHIGPRRIAGFVLAMAGVAVLNRVWREDFRWTGMAASLIFVSSFVCEAIYSAMGKPIVQKASPVKMLTISLLLGTVGNLVIDGAHTAEVTRTLSLNLWLLLLAVALVCTALGYTLWFVVIRDCPVNVAALTIFAQTVFGVGIAAVWLHERLHAGQLWGSALIVAGLVLGLSRQVKRTPKLQED